MNVFEDIGWLARLHGRQWHGFGDGFGNGFDGGRSGDAWGTRRPDKSEPFLALSAIYDSRNINWSVKNS